MKKVSIVMLVMIFLFGCYDEVPTGIDINSIQKDNTRPSCSITAPSSYSSHVVGTSITIQINASDNENNLANVKIYFDNNILTTINSQPFTYSMNTSNVSTGSHIIKAVATDSQNAVSEESVVNVIMTAEGSNNPPVCAITSPANNSSFTIGSTITILANATDSDGSIKEVRFYMDGALKSTDLIEPYSYAWNTTGETSGNHIIKVIAKDNLNSEVEKSVTVNLTSGGTNIPVTGVSLDIASVNLTVNQTQLLTETIAPTNASNQSVNWTSSNATIATVVTGLVTAKAVGIDTVTVTTVDGNKKATCVVTVTLPVIPDGFVFVEGGTFQMGQINPNIGGTGESDDEQPVHTVTLSSFYIEKHEVTQTKWITTMGSNPSHFTSGQNRPVEMVSWYDALVYCNKRSITEGLTPCYSINGSTNPTIWGAVPTNSNTTWNSVVCNWSAKGYRMPTEAEWEYAAKGGKHSQNYTYSGSNTISDVAWYSSNSYVETHPVGGKLPNELGIYDMSGNVYEWNWDWYWYGSYSTSAQNNPTGVTSGSYRVLRGGGFFDTNECRSAARNREDSYDYYYNIGFRTVRIP